MNNAAPISVNSFNPLQENYMVPDLWWVMGASSAVHKSRLIPIVFYSVPDLIKPLYNYLGLPLSFYMKNYVSSADTVRQSISDLCLRFRTKIIKTTAQKIADPQTQARVKFMNSSSNNLATLLLAKDEEWIETVTSLTGLDNLLSQMYELLTASTRGIPVTKLLGLSPRGFNATGEYDENNFYDVMSGYSSAIVVPAMERVAEYLLCFKAGTVASPKFEFNPRKLPTPKEKAEINNLKSDCVNKLVTAGIITNADAVKAIQEDNFKMDWINPDDYKEPNNPLVENDLINKYLDRANNRTTDADFNSSDHPRDKDGKFKRGGNSTSKKNKNTRKQKTYKEMCGTAYKEYSGKPAQAIDHLLEMKNGYVPSAAYKNGVGNIDFLWGEPKSKTSRGYGFAHIIEKRAKQGIDGIALIKKIPEIIEKGIVGEGDDGRKTITYKDNMIVLAKESGSNWILTEYILYRGMQK